MIDRSEMKLPRVMPADRGKLPLKFPKITIDPSKCTVPFWCKKCLQACPQMVFAVYCKQPERLKEADPREPGVYDLVPVRRYKCDSCNKCVEVCPENAITIT